MSKFKFLNCTEEQLWRYVGGHLSERGIDVVLVGGAVVSVYSEGVYQSGDLGFICIDHAPDNLEAVMLELGFRRQGRHYVHPECEHLFIEFPAGPLGIGADTAIRPVESKYGGKTLRILSPTDCIKDRLASFKYFSARACLDQAVLVAERHPFQLEEVKRWCAAEDADDVFEKFLSRVRRK